MPSVLVTTSHPHPVRTDIVVETLPDDWQIDTCECDEEGFGRRSSEQLVAAASGYDAVFLRAGRATRELFETTDSLRVLAVHGSGYSRVDVDAATENDVVVTHSPNAPAPAVVEYTVCAMIALFRDLTGIHEQTTSGTWDKGGNAGRELGRTTVGIVGAGTIGLEVGRAVRTFGADVIAYDPYVAGDRDDSRIYPRTDRKVVADAGIELVDFDELLDRADLLSLHAPLTDDTRNLIGADELSAMNGDYLVNVARGGLVDEAALADAVANDRLNGVALDVLEDEPPDADNPLLTASDVVVTPHVAGVTDGYLARAARLGARKIETALAGDRPDTTVNPSVFD